MIKNKKSHSYRIVYLDTMRFLAALWVFTTHFINMYRPGVFRLWTVMPFSLFLNGLTGKLAVTLFCVVLGYLAYESGQRNTNMNIFQYTITRYIYFFSFALFLNTLYVVVTNAGLLSLVWQSMGVGQVIYSSIFLKGDIVGFFGILRPLFIASLLCFINGKYKLSYKEVLVQSIVMIFIGQTWVGIALLGNLAEILLQNEKVNAVLKKLWIQLPLIIMVFVLIKRPENNTTHLIDELCMTVVVLIFANNRWVRAVLEHKGLQKINQYYMGVYVCHVVVSVAVVTYLFGNFSSGNSRLHFLLAYVVSLVLIIILARMFEYVAQRLARIFISCLDWLLARGRVLYAELRICKQ